MTLVLASASPRRAQLLRRLELPFEVVPSGVEEPEPNPGEYPDAYAQRLAAMKAVDVAWMHRQDVVLGADTVVAVDGHILGKPVDPADAVRMLMLLSGKEHRVVTGVTLQCGDHTYRDSEAAQVTMRPFTEEEAWRYVETGEPMDKAGAYAVQGLGGSLVERVEGCCETVIGLPLCAVQRLLHACGQQTALDGAKLCTHSPVL